MNIGQPKEVVEVKEPAVPFKGDEVKAPERQPEKVTEKVPTRG